METNQSYLTSAIRQFNYYKALGEKAIDQLEPEQLFTVPNEDSNSIAIIVKHLWGNMLSRWTDFLTTDGEKPWRKRDEEFDVSTTLNNQLNKTEVMKWWNEGWDCLFKTLDSLTEEDLSKMIYIRNEGHTVMEAINRQLAHYPYHIGQMVYIAKMLKKTSWDSLSIPKNKSGDYNTQKFSQEKSTKHFTEEELKKLKKD
ncbi:MAG: DUF1572 family protein [Bacteroidota bacterium]|nr:DUF1572 family protein [Bacteroidota bacterium]